MSVVAHATLLNQRVSHYVQIGSVSIALAGTIRDVKTAYSRTLVLFEPDGAVSGYSGLRASWVALSSCIEIES